MNLVQELSFESGIPTSDIWRIVGSAPARYKEYYIDKKNGGKRLIAHPSRELKILQRVILQKYLEKFPVHRAAMAYVKSRNIYENAVKHSNMDLILKLDFKSFFPSITTRDWKKYNLENNTVFQDLNLSISTNLLFWGKGTNIPKCLSIGAPTSPCISNIIMHKFDRDVSIISKRYNLVYTRYADDITISGDDAAEIRKFERKLRSFVSRMETPKLRFNDEKRGLYTKGQKRLVTGLVITPTGEISIGRERKRLISALIHKYSNNILDIYEIGELKGLIGFSLANEPTFVESMRSKYGNEVIRDIMKFHLPSRENL